MRLKSRATIPDAGTTVMVFEQQVNGLPVYQGEVLVNVNRAGQIISVGSESYPQLQITNSETISPSQAISAAASALGINNFAPQSKGTTKVLTTYGDLSPEYVQAPNFSGGVFTDDIAVTRTVFPTGDQGRLAYKFTLTTPQYEGIMWEVIVDAQTSDVLRRISLTAFNGEPGGGHGTNRRSTLRPDLQDMVEGYNPLGTAKAKVFDALPTTFSGRFGFGRTQAGIAPNYAAESVTARNSGRGFRFSFVSARNENPLFYVSPFSQVLRGVPDAQNPTAESPFGWFYLPTDTGGGTIASADNNRAATNAFGYTMSTEAKDRNLAENSPNGDKNQPFSADLTPLSSNFALRDGRVLSSVFQSNYTEGNNVFVADDRANDNESTHGVKGFALNRQFTQNYFDFTNGYEFGGADAVAPAGGAVIYPTSANADIYSGTTTLFHYNNLMHDYLYSIGFTENLWNFQQDNFGKGGTGKDAVSAQVQDGSGTNNANFGTPAEGGRPRMQMFLFTDSTFHRADGDFDFDVVAHEYHHGVSNRSVAKGSSGGLGLTLVGESGGQGEGWSDYIAATMTDDDAVGEFVTGEFDVGIRRMPYTNFRWSYGSINQRILNRRDQLAPDIDGGTGTPFAVHRTGEVWSATLWDMRELLIMKDPNGIFFDGDRRLGGGTSFFIGNRPVQSLDGKHPIDYRASFNTNDAATIKADKAIVRPGLIANEIANNGGSRKGPLATAVSKGARLSDTLVLRGMQLSPLNPSMVDSRDSILLADRELTGGENQAIIWRAFASHGIGLSAESTSNNVATQSAPIVIEDFAVPAGVTQCEQTGPLAPPSFALSNAKENAVTITINGGNPVSGASGYTISRATSANGPFVRIATLAADQTTYEDNNNGQGLDGGETFYYQVRVSRNSECVSSPSDAQGITVSGGVIVKAPVFSGVEEVKNTASCNSLTVSWNPASSNNPQADIVYDVYRVDRVAHGDGTQEPTFEPTASNRVAADLRNTSFTDTGLRLGQVYYYIVQARDGNKIDTNNTGNRVTRLNAPTSSSVTSTPVFAREDFENPSANTRFTPVLVDSGNEPNDALAAFQRVTGITTGEGQTSSMMYGPNFNPVPPGAPGGGQSDFASVIGPLNLSNSSMMEFDHFFSTEANFDGGNIEIALGSPANFNATPYTDNVTTFEANNYIVEGAYNARLDGTLSGVPLSALINRRSYSGIKGLHHARIALGAFAPGSVNNPQGLPVYLRFRATSDVSTNVGPNSGWYIDNLVINNPSSCQAPVVTTTTIEDNDQRVAYSGGWHLVNDSNASDGHFRMNNSKDPSHFAKLTFDVEGQSGAITYHYATSPKGGSAEVYVDGVKKGVIDYRGSQGSMRSPVFGPSVRVEGLASGSHTLELRAIKGTVYVDKFTLESAKSNANPSSGPGQTNTNQNMLGVGQQALSEINIAPGTTELSVVAATSADIPIQLVLIDPSGTALRLADSTNGVAVINQQLTQGGTYVIKVINIGLGPVEVWTAATPLVTR
ncbi:MAG: M36 family metallopeptidase [Acidobacteria bacterium]|nr:M36 family metallopeptidase [Acidobacteriota bacterium]